MKYILLSLLLSSAFSLSAQNPPPKNGPPSPAQRPPLNETQKKVRSQMLEKYDANKDGKLDRTEFDKISEADKKKIKEVGLGRPQPQKPVPPQKQSK